MEEFAEKIEQILCDYRVEDKLNPKKENILKWVSQFREENQKVILEETLNILNKRYLTADDVNIFLKGLISNKKLVGSDVKNYWENVSLLNIQKNGKSQSILNEKFQKLIFDKLEIELPIDDLKKKYFIHLDDFLFTGNRLRNDLRDWIPKAPSGKRLDIIYFGYYKSGQYYTSSKWIKKIIPIIYKSSFGDC
jgi:hypothetical protein